MNLNFSSGYSSFPFISPTPLTVTLARSTNLMIQYTFISSCEFVDLPCLRKGKPLHIVNLRVFSGSLLCLTFSRLNLKAAPKMLPYLQFGISLQQSLLTLPFNFPKYPVTICFKEDFGLFSLVCYVTFVLCPELSF